MYQYEFFDPDRYQRYCEERGNPKRSSSDCVPRHFVGRGDIELVRSSFWSEHCLNCGEPECFEECPLYAPKADGRCVRLFFGLRNAKEFPEFPFHCEIAFDTWAKIESGVYPGTFSLADAEARERENIAECNKQWFAMNAGAAGLTLFPLEQRQQLWHVKVRDAAHAGTQDGPTADTFLLQLYSYEDQAFRLAFEITVDKALCVIFRRELRVEPGFNQFLIDAREPLATDERKWTRIYPDPKHSGHVVLLFCEYVRLRPADGPAL